jgi:hypothetical protein
LTSFRATTVPTFGRRIGIGAARQFHIDINILGPEHETTHFRDNLFIGWHGHCQYLHIMSSDIPFTVIMLLFTQIGSDAIR